MLLAQQPGSEELKNIQLAVTLEMPHFKQALAARYQTETPDGDTIDREEVTLLAMRCMVDQWMIHDDDQRSKAALGLLLVHFQTSLIELHTKHQIDGLALVGRCLTPSGISDLQLADLEDYNRLTANLTETSGYAAIDFNALWEKAKVEGRLPE